MAVRKNERTDRGPQSPSGGLVGRGSTANTDAGRLPAQATGNDLSPCGILRFREARAAHEQSRQASPQRGLRRTPSRTSLAISLRVNRM